MTLLVREFGVRYGFFPRMNYKLLGEPWKQGQADVLAALIARSQATLRAHAGVLPALSSYGARHVDRIRALKTTLGMDCHPIARPHELPEFRPFRLRTKPLLRNDSYIKIGPRRS